LKLLRQNFLIFFCGEIFETFAAKFFKFFSAAKFLKTFAATRKKHNKDCGGKMSDKN
jgi:hypothetical protein